LINYNELLSINSNYLLYWFTTEQEKWYNYLSLVPSHFLSLHLKKKKKIQFRKACVNPKKPLGMAAIYSLYIINKSGGLIFYKVRCLLPFNSITRAFWGVMLDWIMIESNTSDWLLLIITICDVWCLGYCCIFFL